MSDSKKDHERAESDGYCHACAGTGIGQNGDPDTSRCHVCHGSGEVKSTRDEDIDRADYERDRDIDDRLTGDLGDYSGNVEGL